MRRWTAGIAIALGLASLVAIPAWLVVADRDETVYSVPRMEVSARQYADERSCRECHPSESAWHANSGHRWTLRTAGDNPAARWLDGQELPDPEDPEIKWHYQIVGDRLQIERRKPGEQAKRFLADYGLGSGRHAMTFVTLQEGKSPLTVGMDVYEHRISWRAHPAELMITPGHHKGSTAPNLDDCGRRDSAAKCIGCHAVTVATNSPMPFAPREVIPNVGCQACHGPAGHHVERARAGETDLTLPFGSAPTTPAEERALCEKCHRGIDPMDPSRHLPQDLDSVRLQGVGLHFSRCQQLSNAAISCVRCHDPHDAIEQNSAPYNRECRSCHDQPPEKSCPVTKDGDCVGCHMPKRTLSIGLEFTDHWIRKPRKD